LVAALKLPNTRRQIEAAATGTSDSMKNIAKRDFLNVRLPVPSQEEQRRIAAAVKLADDAIQKAQVELSAARDLKRSLEAGFLAGEIDKQSRAKVETPAGVFPQGWAVSPLKNLAAIGSGVTLNQERAAKENACRYLTVAHVQRGTILTEDVRFLELSDEERKTRLLETGDILVVEGHANSMEIGRAAMFDSQGIATPDQQEASAYRGAGSRGEPPDREHVISTQEVCHGAEQGSVPEGAVDARVLRAVRVGATV
jgi:type I restriction enzyme S subunit